MTVAERPEREPEDVPDKEPGYRHLDNMVKLLTESGNITRALGLCNARQLVDKASIEQIRGLYLGCLSELMLKEVLMLECIRELWRLRSGEKSEDVPEFYKAFIMKVEEANAGK